MNKLVIGGIAVVILLGVGWLLLQPSTAGYIAAFDTEVAQLEWELQELEIMVTSGALTPEEAAVAQRRIVERLDAIATVTVDTEKVRLSASQRAQLNAGLDRLRSVLLTYQATIQVIDEQVMALPEADRPTLGRGRTRAAVSANETVAAVEGFVAEVTGEPVGESTDLIVVPEETMADEEVVADEETPEISDEETVDSAVDTDAEDDSAALELELEGTATVAN